MRTPGYRKLASTNDFLKIGERGQIAALMDDAKDHRRISGGGNPGEEHQVLPVGPGANRLRSRPPSGSAAIRSKVRTRPS